MQFFFSQMRRKSHMYRKNTIQIAPSIEKYTSMDFFELMR